MSKKKENKEEIISEDFDNVKSGSEEVPGKSPISDNRKPENKPDKAADDEVPEASKSTGEAKEAKEDFPGEGEKKDDCQESDITLSESYTKLEEDHLALITEHSDLVDKFLTVEDSIKKTEDDFNNLLSGEADKIKGLKEKLKESEFKVKLLTDDLNVKADLIVSLKKQLVTSKKREKTLPESGKMIRH